MATFTYDDFEREAKASGLRGQFSAADLALAQRDPDAGMSLLNYKRDYANASTDEARALANMGAENVRSSFGEYTGGTDGSGFYKTQLSPTSFSSGTAPEYSGYDTPRPEYNNRYDDQIQDLLSTITNWKDFSYDPGSDELYQNYRKQYTREGQRATEDALGAAAAASGGLPSSYAQTSASQAANYYAAQMTDKIPELYQLAYTKYLNDYNRQLTNLGAVQGAEQSDYDKYKNELAQWNTDRDFDYNTYLTRLGQFNTDRSFGYQQLLDEISSQNTERENQLNEAILAGNYGDYSQLRKRGIDTSSAELQAELDNAQRQAQLEALLTGGGAGGGSGGGSSGTDMDLKKAEKLAKYSVFNDDSLAALRAEYGDDDEYITAAYGFDQDEYDRSKGRYLDGRKWQSTYNGVKTSLAGGDTQAAISRVMRLADSMSTSQWEMTKELFAQYGVSL